jgi:hypothetical protein
VALRAAVLGAAAMLALAAPGCNDGGDGDPGDLSRAEIQEIRSDCAREAYGGAQEQAKDVPSSVRGFFEEMERGNPSPAEIRDQFGKAFAPVRGLIKNERECLRRAGVKPRKNAGKNE